jgi:hypothetical protein
MSTSRPTQDLVRDAKLETKFHLGGDVEHGNYSIQGAKEHRPTWNIQEWQRKSLLGIGSFGKVWLQQCVSGEQRGQLRAVKEIEKGKYLINHERELEAVFKFSQQKVSVLSSSVVRTEAATQHANPVCPLLRQVAWLVRG